jgi:Holliday junction resolvase RusA-like endonuclease
VIRLFINPCPKPRMTRSDRWRRRPCVVRYWEFCDFIRDNLEREFELTGSRITFVIPVPASWSKKRKEAAIGQPHTQRPDLSNLLKALEDAHQSDDAAIHTYREISKVWGWQGEIKIEGAKN